MRRFLEFSIAFVTFLLAGASAQAQSTGFTQRGFPTDPYMTGVKLYSKTWTDLNQAQKRAVANPGDWYRYDVARGQMDLLQRTWADGTFDRAQLNAAISDLQQILQFNNLAPRDRDVVAGDLEQMRDLRINYGH